MVWRSSSAVPLPVRSGLVGLPARTSTLPRLSMMAIPCGRRPGTAAETRLRIACTASGSRRAGPRMVSSTLACADCCSAANSSRCGSTRCTRAFRTPSIMRMLRASSPSSARVRLMSCSNWEEVSVSPRSKISSPTVPSDGRLALASSRRAAAMSPSGTRIWSPAAPIVWVMCALSSRSAIWPASRMSRSP